MSEYQHKTPVDSWSSVTTHSYMQKVFPDLRRAPMNVSMPENPWDLSRHFVLSFTWFIMKEKKSLMFSCQLNNLTWQQNLLLTFTWYNFKSYTIPLLTWGGIRFNWLDIHLEIINKSPGAQLQIICHHHQPARWAEDGSLQMTCCLECRK